MIKNITLVAIVVLFTFPSVVLAEGPASKVSPLAHKIYAILSTEEEVDWFARGGKNVAHGLEQLTPELIQIFLDAEKATGTPWQTGLGVCLSEGLPVGGVNSDDPNGGSFGLCQISLITYKTNRPYWTPREPDPSDNVVMAETAMNYMRILGLDDGSDGEKEWKSKFVGPLNRGGSRWNKQPTQANAAFFTMWHLRRVGQAAERWLLH